MPSINISNLTLAYPQLVLFEDLNLNHQQPGLIALIGRNGIGKSTLIRCLAGLKTPSQGQVSINGKLLTQLDAQQRARMVSLVLTHQTDSGWMTVEEMVGLGRNPYTNWWGKLRKDDQRRINESIEITGLQPLRQRPLHELSDGQLQKALLARALTQDGDLVFLDEPLVHLDPPTKWEIMQLLQRTAHHQNKIMVMATHELELSINHADKIWIAHQQSIQAGIPEDLMVQKAFNRVFDSKNYHFEHWQPALSEISLPLEGDSRLIPWTARALTRYGLDKTSFKDTRVVVEAQSENYHWTLYRGDKSITCTSIEGLIKELSNA